MNGRATAVRRPTVARRQTVIILAESSGFARRTDLVIFRLMPKLRPAIRYGIDAVLILALLFSMTYFSFKPAAFNAWLA